MRVKTEDIMEIIDKVRELFKYQPDYRNIINQKASIILGETSGGLIIRSITFDYYERIFVTSSSITLDDEHGTTRKVLYEYNGFDELLRL